MGFLQTKPSQPSTSGVYHCTGGTDIPHDVVGIVFAFATAPAGSDHLIAFVNALEQLKARTVAINAHAVIFVSFEKRDSLGKDGCGNQIGVFEVYAWGTAIRWRT